MRAPAFQMYARDWLSNVKLRRCSPAARGAWIDVMCLMHGSDEYGVLRWPLNEIAGVANVPPKLLRELAARDVLKGAESGAIDYVYTPRHGGKDGEPVVLVTTSSGPCWYCSRLVRDEWIRRRRGNNTQFDTDNQPPKATPKRQPKRQPKPPIGERQGDGPASASATALKATPSEPSGSAKTPDPVKDEIWKTGRAMLEGQGDSREGAGAFLGKLCKDFGQVLVLDAVRDCARVTPAEAKAWLTARCQERRAQSGNKSAAIETRNRAAVDAAMEEANRARS